MAFQVSPGVQVKEIDATNVIPAVSTSIGGFAGSFNWGPVDQIVTVGSESELAEQFGTPDDNTAKYFLTAAAFLKYGNALKVVRAVTGHDNATADGTGQLIKNDDDYSSVNFGVDKRCLRMSEDENNFKKASELINKLDPNKCMVKLTRVLKLQDP